MPLSEQGQILPPRALPSEAGANRASPHIITCVINVMPHEKRCATRFAEASLPLGQAGRPELSGSDLRDALQPGLRSQPMGLAVQAGPPFRSDETEGGHRTRLRLWAPYGEVGSAHIEAIMPWSRASLKDVAVPPKCWRIPAPPLAAAGGRLRDP